MSMSSASGSRVKVGAKPCSISSSFHTKLASSTTTHWADQPLSESAVEGSDIIREPLLNLIVSNDDVYVIALLLRTFTDSANCLHFDIISDADREFTDIQIARPLFL